MICDLLRFRFTDLVSSSCPIVLYTLLEIYNLLSKLLKNVYELPYCSSYSRTSLIKWEIGIKPLFKLTSYNGL